MRRLARKLKLALAGLVGGFAFACGNPAPREVAPLAPRPDPMAPSTPSGPAVPGAPDPLPKNPGPTFPSPDDAGVGPVPTTSAYFQSPQFRSAITPPSDASPSQTADAGVDAELPPVPDGGLPPDASKRPD